VSSATEFRTWAEEQTILYSRFLLRVYPVHSLVLSTHMVLHSLRYQQRNKMRQIIVLFK